MLSPSKKILVCRMEDFYSVASADVKSLIIHPASTTHSRFTEAELEAVGIRPTTIRISVGAENPKDLIADLEEGFRQI